MGLDVDHSKTHFCQIYMTLCKARIAFIGEAKRLSYLQVGELAIKVTRLYDTSTLVSMQ